MLIKKFVHLSLYTIFITNHGFQKISIMHIVAAPRSSVASLRSPARELQNAQVVEVMR